MVRLPLREQPRRGDTQCAPASLSAETIEGVLSAFPIAPM